MHIISRSRWPQAATLASLTDLKLMKQRIHTMPRNNQIHKAPTFSWTKRTIIAQDIRVTVYFELYVDCGWGGDLDSRTSNESTADILRNQGTQSLDRDSEKAMTIRLCYGILLTIAIYFTVMSKSVRMHSVPRWWLLSYPRIFEGVGGCVGE